MIKQFLLLYTLTFSLFYITLSVPTYAMTLDDEEEDAEDVAYLLKQAKKESKSESFSKANALLEKAKMYGVSKDDAQEASRYVAGKKQARDDRLEQERKRERESG